MKLKTLFTAIVAVLLLTSCGTSYEQRLEECDEVGEFKEGFARCLQDYKYFFIDEKGKKMSDDYDQLTEFENGYAIGYKNDVESYFILSKDKCKVVREVNELYGKVSKTGDIWICLGLGALQKPEGMYALLNVESGSFKYSSPKGEYLYSIDEESGNVIFTRVADENILVSGYNVRNNYMPEQSLRYQHYEFSIYDGQGNELVPYGKYSYVGRFSHGRATYSTTGYSYYNYTGVVDNDKKLQIERRILDNTKRLGPAFKMGYIDTKGEIVVPEQYSFALDYNDEGHATVEIWDKYGMRFSENTVFCTLDLDGNVLERHSNKTQRRNIFN